MIKKEFFLAILIFFVFFPKKAFAADAYLFLSPTSGSYSEEFSFDLRINTGGQAVGGVDVYLDFPKNLLQAQGFEKGNAFPEAYSLVKQEEGKWRIFAYFPYTQASGSFSGNNGLIGKIKFLPLSQGTAQITFICENNQTNETNIIEKTTIKDIVSCSANLGGAYQVSVPIGGLTNSLPTPTPRSTPVPTKSSQTNNPPVTGFSWPTIGLLFLAIISGLTGLAIRF